MKTRIILIIAFILASIPAIAQHAAQVDDGAGHYSWLTGQNPGGTFVLPAGGGTLLVSSAPSISSAWLLGGNLSSSPNNQIGTLDATNFVIITNGVTQLTARSGGGIELPATTAAGVGAIYQNGSLLMHTFGTGNAFVGVGAGNLSVTGAHTVGIGQNALHSLTTGADNIAIGYAALSNNTTSYGNVAIGSATLNSPSVGSENTAIGYINLQVTTSYGNTAVGHDVMPLVTTGNQNTGLGRRSLFALTTGSQNVEVGGTAGNMIVSGSQNTFVGTSADAAGDYSNSMALGSGAIVDASNHVQIGNGSVTVVNTSGVLTSSGGLNITGGTSSIGTALNMNSHQINNVTDPTANQDAATKIYVDNKLTGAVSGTTNTIAKFTSANAVGNSAATDDGTTFSYTGTHINSATDFQIGGTTVLKKPGTANMFVGGNSGNTGVTGSDNTAVGNFSALQAVSTGSANTAVGAHVLSTVTTGNGNTGVGNYAYQSGNGTENTAIGVWALESNNGDRNTTVGVQTLYAFSTASQNTAIGWHAMGDAISTSATVNNVAVGLQALTNNTSGADNTALGSFAGFSNTSGTNNTFVGRSADASSGSLTNATAIGHGASVTASNTMQFGDGSVTLVNTSGAYNTATGYRVSGAATSGTVLRGNGTNYVGSTTTFPNAATTGDLMLATSANTYGSMPDVATGSVLLSGGVGAVPTYGQVTNAVVASGTFSNITGIGSQSQALNMNSHLINNVTDPSAAQDAATKIYVDTKVNGAVSGTANRLAKFTSANVVGNSLLSDNGTTVTSLGSIVPNATNSFDLGSSSLRWAGFYLAGGLDHSLNGDNPLDNSFVSGHGVASGGLNYQVTSDGYVATFSNTSAATSDGIQIAVNTADGSSRALTVTNGTNFNPTGGVGNRNESFYVKDNGTTFIGTLPASSSTTMVTSNSGVLESRSFASLLGSSAWLIGGNTTGAASTFGSNDAFDVSMVANGTEQLRLRSSGGIEIPVTTLAGVGAFFAPNGDLLMHFPGNANFFAGQRAGNLSVSGSFNTGTGVASLLSVTSGDNNTASGYQSLRANTDGFENSAIGFQSLNSNTSGARNAAVGALSLRNNSIGGWNSGIGQSALSGNTTGSNNTGAGANTLFTNSIGNNNTAVGYQALYNSTSDNNTAIGSNALGTNTTGTLNTAIGTNADVTLGGLTNATAIGANAIVSQSNSLVLGNGVNVGIGTAFPAQRLEVKSGNILLSNAGTAGELRFAEPAGSGTNYSSFKAQVQAGDITYTLPANSGSANGDVLTIASGAAGTTPTLAWSTPSSGGSGVTLMRTTANVTDNSNAILTNVTGLSFAVGASETWAFDFELSCAAGGVGPGGQGMEFAITIPTGATIEATIGGSKDGGNQYGKDRISAGGAATAVFLNKNATLGPVHIHGVVVNSTTAGTVQLQFAHGGNDGTTMTIYANSFGKAYKF